MVTITDRHYPASIVESIIARHLRLTPDDGELYEQAKRCVYNAFDHAEDYTNRIICDSMATFSYAEVEGSVVSLPTAPVKSIVAVRYLASDGEWHTLDEASYRLYGNDRRAVLELATIPQLTTEERLVRFEVVAHCGFSDYNPDDEREVVEGIALPGGIEQAVMLLAGNFFEHQGDEMRGSISQLKTSAEYMLNFWRVYPYGG